MTRLSMLSVALFFMICNILHSQHEIKPKNEKAIQSIVQTMEEGWNSKNGEKFASAFAPDHDFVVWFGMYLPNQSAEENARAHQNLFDGPYREFDIRLVTDKIRMLAPDVALTHLLAGGRDRSEAELNKPTHIISLLLTKKGGEWKIVSFHNLDIDYDQLKRAFGESYDQVVGEMYANWSR